MSLARCAATSATRCSRRSCPRSVRLAEAPSYGRRSRSTARSSRGALAYQASPHELLDAERPRSRAPASGGRRATGAAPATRRWRSPERWRSETRTSSGGLGRGLAALDPDRRSRAYRRPASVPLRRSTRPQPGPATPLFDADELRQLADIDQRTRRPAADRGDARRRRLPADRRRARLRAARAGRPRAIPAVVRDANEQEQLELALVENIQRADLNAIEEARAFQQLIDAFGLTQERRRRARRPFASRHRQHVAYPRARHRGPGRGRRRRHQRRSRPGARRARRPRRSRRRSGHGRGALAVGAPDGAARARRAEPGHARATTRRAATVRPRHRAHGGTTCGMPWAPR